MVGWGHEYNANKVKAQVEGKGQAGRLKKPGVNKVQDLRTNQGQKCTIDRTHGQGACNEQVCSDDKV